MKKRIQISIPTPCHENWNAMTPADKGRFCASCQKTVLDFTKSSDREIASILKNTDNACGRFRTTQLDRDLIVPKEKSTIWLAASVAIVSFLTIGNHEVFAQTPVNTEQHVSEADEIKIGKTALPHERIITGTVVDEEGLPIPGANVVNTSSGNKTVTDFDGLFSIEANEGETIEITYISMVSQQVVVTESDHIKIIMQVDSESISTGMVGTVQRRTFFGRVFHSVGNLFRSDNE